MELNYDDDDDVAVADYYQIRDSDLDDCIGTHSIDDKEMQQPASSGGVNKRVSADEWIGKK